MKKFFLISVIVLIFSASIYKLAATVIFDTGSNDYFAEISEKFVNNTASKSNCFETQASFTGYLSAANAILIDVLKGDILFEKNSKKRCYPASTTKILTALLAIENCRLDEKIIVGDEANFPPLGSSKSGIRYGEKLTMEQLLNCLLIPSGNDAAYSIAVYVARKVSGDKNLSLREAVQYFSELMNKRAKELGAQDSRFVNPDGSHKAEHYSTAYDLSLIAQETLKHKNFRDIVCRESYRIPDVNGVDKNGKQRSEVRILINTNKLLLSNNPHYLKIVTGVKTGHTEEAGYCLVSSGEANGKNVLAVVMNSSEEKVWSDSKKLLENGIKN